MRWGPQPAASANEVISPLWGAVGEDRQKVAGSKTRNPNKKPISLKMLRLLGGLVVDFN